MKKGIITILIITMLVSIGLVSCKNEVQAPDDYLVSVSFENDSSRALSANLEDFKPETYYWKYAAKKADASNLLSGQTANYDNEGREAGAQWIAEGQPGFGSGTGTAYEAFKVQGFSQGLWNFTLYGYKKVAGDNPTTDTVETEYYVLVYSGEITGHLLKAGDNNTHSVSVVVSPIQSGNGTLVVKTTGTDAIKLDAAAGSQVVANAKIKVGVNAINAQDATPVLATEDYEATLAPGAYKVTVQFTNDDGGVVYASGSVIATVYSGLTTTVKGNLTEIVTYADFGAKQNPDIITTTIGTSEITQGTTSSTVNFTSTTATKVTASMPTSAAKSLIAEMEQALDAKTSTAESTTSELTLNLSVNTTAATETTITYEIGMEATLEYQKKDATGTDKTTTKSTVETLDDFVTVKIELQRGLTDVKVRHSDELMTACSSLSELNNKQVPGPDASEEAKAEARKGYFYYQDPYENESSKAMLYIRTYKFSPFTLSYTVPKVVAIIGSQQFETLESAIAASTGADTITMVSSVTLTKDIQVEEKELTIDLNGFTVTGSDHILPDEVYFTVEEKYGDYYDYEYDPGYIRIRHKEASIGTTLYNRLPQAFLAVTDSTPTTIVVKRDSVVIVKNSASTPEFTGNKGITIAAGRDITLDLNGFTVKNAVNENKASQIFDVSDGTLTIMDSSDTNKDGTGTGLLTNAVMEGTQSGEWWSTPQYNYATNVIKNSGTLNVESGRIMQTAASSICYAVDNNSNNYDTTLNVTGGLISGVGTVVRQFCNSTTKENTVNVSGGSIITDGYSAIWIQLPGKTGQKKKAALNVTGGVISGSSYSFYDYSYGDIYDEVLYTISGGTFNGDIFSYGANFDICGGIFNGELAIKISTTASDPISLNIAGGTFQGECYNYNTVEPIKMITGGLFAEDPSDFVCDGYYAVKEESSGFWSVKCLYWIDYHADAFAGGTGTESDPYQIATAEQLALLAYLLRYDADETTREAYKGKSYKLTADINLSGKCWVPISNFSRKASNNLLFCGTFDGNDKTISGLTNNKVQLYDGEEMETMTNSTTPADTDGEYTYGLFGTVCNATIKNVVLNDVAIEVGYGIKLSDGKRFVGDSVGALVGCVRGTTSVSRVSVSGSVMGYDATGGIVGRCEDRGDGLTTLFTFSDLDNAASVTAIRRSSGIVGYAAGYYPAYAEGKFILKNANQSVRASFVACINTGSVESLGPASDYAEGSGNYYGAGALTHPSCDASGSSITKIQEDYEALEIPTTVIGNTGTITTNYKGVVHSHPYILFNSAVNWD